MPPSTNRSEEWDDLESIDDLEQSFAELMRRAQEERLAQTRERMANSAARDWWSMSPLQAFPSGAMTTDRPGATTGGGNIPPMPVRPGTRRVMNDGSIITTSDGQPIMTTRHPGRRIVSNDLGSVTVSGEDGDVIANNVDFGFVPQFDVEFPQSAPRGERPAKGKRHLSRGDRQMLHNPAPDDKKIDDLVVSDLF